jgi:hypothetical protein
MIDLCDVCGGTGRLMPDAEPCGICRGTGSGSEEKVGLRLEIWRIRAALEIIARGCNWMGASDADAASLSQQLRMVELNAKAALRGLSPQPTVCPVGVARSE